MTPPRDLSRSSAPSSVTSKPIFSGETPASLITRNAEWQHEGVERASSLEEALDLAGEGSVHIAGGGEIYRAALPIATHLDLTEIDAALDGDTYFPEFDRSEWREVASEHHPSDERHAHAFTFRMYERVEDLIADRDHGAP